MTGDRHPPTVLQLWQSCLAQFVFLFFAVWMGLSFNHSVSKRSVYCVLCMLDEFHILLLISHKFLEPHRPLTLKTASDICGGFGVGLLNTTNLSDWRNEVFVTCAQHSGPCYTLVTTLTFTGRLPGVWAYQVVWLADSVWPQGGRDRGWTEAGSRLAAGTCHNREGSSTQVDS